MRRAIVTGTATVSGVVLLLGLKPHGATPHIAQNFSISSSSGTTATSSPAAASPSPSASPNTSTKSSSGATSGSSGSTHTTAPAASATNVVTGDAAQTIYGPVQLQVTFSGKKITNISVLEYPQESFRDQQINEYALPVLNQEAISAQSAKIDAVSGATYTSEGYLQSLQSAIDKAGA